MPIRSEETEKSQQHSITLKFDVKEGHQIDAETLIMSVRSTKIIAQEMAKLISPKAKVKVLADPPKKGSFEIDLAIALSANVDLTLVSLGGIEEDFACTVAREWSGIEESITELTEDLVRLIAEATASLITLPAYKVEELENKLDQKKNQETLQKMGRAKSEFYRKSEIDFRVLGISVFNSRSEKRICKEEFSKHRSKKRRKK